jgi:AbrB family looped-hinge helix DNA binding protein
MNGEPGTVSKESSTSRLVAEAIVSLLRDIDRVPQIVRDVIQFYLRNVAVFKARVLDNNRITIPKEEVELLGIQPGDYVAVILSKIERKSGDVYG